MKKLDNKTPSIIISKVVEHKDGSATYYFDYEKDFEDLIKNKLGIKKLTKKHISDFLLECLENSIKYESRNKEK